MKQLKLKTLMLLKQENSCHQQQPHTLLPKDQSLPHNQLLPKCHNNKSSNHNQFSLNFHHNTFKALLSLNNNQSNMSNSHTTFKFFLFFKKIIILIIIFVFFFIRDNNQSNLLVNHNLKFHYNKVVSI